MEDDDKLIIDESQPIKPASTELPQNTEQPPKKKARRPPPALLKIT